MYYSSDQAYTWYQATAAAAWSARSDITTCVPPFTNYIWQTGGQTPNGSVVNDVWYSTDGIGAVWTQSALAVPYGPFQSGACAFYYDAVQTSSTNTQPNATLFMLNDLGQFYTSPNLGLTWTLGNGVWNITGGFRNFMNVLIDRDNIVYVFSGQNYVDSNIYWSNNYGGTWYTLAATNALNLPNSVAFSYATTSCAAFRLWQDANSGLQYKSIAIYGGSVWLSDSSIVESIHGVTTSAVSFAANNVPSITWTTAAPAIMPRRTYPACTWNVHAGPNNPSVMFMLGGEVNYTNQILTNDLWYSTDGFYADSHQIQPTSLVNVPGANFTHRRAGSAAYLNNGNLVWWGGKTDDPTNANGGQLNNVYYSSDLGNTWYQATAAAAWTPRSDMSACAAPYTNTIFFAGGQIQSGATINEIWLSTDGIGAVWTQPNTTQPIFAPFQSGACAFFYDSSLANSSSTKTYATLFLIDNNGQYFTSTNQGATFSAGAFGPWLVSAQSRNFMNLLIDRDNFVYAFAGQNYLDPNIYYSTNYGATWFTLGDVNGLALSDKAYFSYATTSCAGLRAYQTNGKFYKTISVYGGSVWLSDGSIVESIHGVTTSTITVPAYVPQISWSNAAPNIMPRRTYCSCAYNTHAPSTSLPIMFMLGGEVNYTNQILTNDVWYSTDGFYADSHQVLPTSLVNVAGNFTHRRAGSAAFLANGNLVWWGGKTDDPSNASAGQLNNVYYSMDSANTWYQATAAAAWLPRSDMAACVAPQTNAIFFAGGQIQTGANLNEVWLSTDGIGAVWTQPNTTLPPFNPFQSGACAFFYDSSLANASYTSSIATMILLDNDGQIWFSKSYGASFTGGAYAPWLVASQSRNFMNLLTDRDNLVYAFAGQNYLDPNIYFSRDVGQTWNVLPATNNLALADQASFSYATTSCAGLLLYPGANGGYAKAISIYGGSIWLSDNSIVESLHGLTSLTTSVTSYKYTPYAASGGSSTGGGAAQGATGSAGPVVGGGSTGAAGGVTAPAQTGGGGGGGSSLSGGAIAGIVIGSVVGAAIILAALVALCWAASRGGKGGKAGSTQLEESQSGRKVPARDAESSQVEMHAV